MDSMEITILRTGAATGVAAKYLARRDAKIATICGCGNQGRISLKALARVRPLARAYAFDIDESRARQFARELSEE
jgi:ornithine cyclodeaminase/alanine dehydrogenase-like protein (mu-crystallin family)